MSFEACAQIVEKGDPVRFRAAMAAPVDARKILFPLYAFNVEVTRAPWVTQEEMIAEMRLQWWRDALEEISAGQNVRKHEVVDALAQVLDQDACKCLDELIAARRWDIYKDPFEDDTHFERYIDATSGHLTWTAARLLGTSDEGAVRDFAYAVGIANLFSAVPELEAANRKPLVRGTPTDVKELSEKALLRWKRAKSLKHSISKSASAALIAGYQAKPILNAVTSDPNRVAAGNLAHTPLRDSIRFSNVSLRGWWR